MARIYKKKKKGRTYYYLRETYHDGKKVRLKWQVYLGTTDTILKKLRYAEEKREKLRIKSYEFGSVFMLNELEKEFDKMGIIALL